MIALTIDDGLKTLTPVLGFILVALSGWFWKWCRSYLKEWREKENERKQAAEAREKKFDADAAELKELAALSLEQAKAAADGVRRLNGSVAENRQEINKLIAGQARLEGTVYGNKALEVNKE